MNRRNLLLLLASAALIESAVATPSSFVPEGTYASGSALVSPAFGGEYVYKEPPDDGRKPSKALLIGPVQRQVYEFFSAEEEQALVKFRDQQLAEQIKAQVISHRKAHFKKTLNLVWPKVIVREMEICVPELASADAVDWQDHLTCYQSTVENK